MEVKDDLILEQINEFVDQNMPNLTRVKKENPDLFGVVSDTLSFLRKRYGGEAVDINEVVKVEEEPKIEVAETNLSQFKVGDKFSSPFALDKIYTIVKIDNPQQFNDITMTIVDISSGDVKDFYTNTEFIEKNLKEGLFVKIEENNEKLPFAVGDLFFIVGFPKDVYAITDISKGNVNYKRIPRSNALTETMKIDDFKGIIASNDVIFLPKANELTFEVGDLLLNKVSSANPKMTNFKITTDVSRVDYIDLNTNSVILVSQRGANTKTMYLTEVVDKIKNGTLEVQKVSQFTALPASSAYDFKIGDTIYYANSPNITYLVNDILSYGDVDVIEQPSGAEWTWDAQSMQDDIDSGDLVIVQQNVLTPTQSQSSQAPATLTVKEQIQQLKDEIDGFQLLADIGDEDALEEVKKLKKELKALKSSNK